MARAIRRNFIKGSPELETFCRNEYPKLVGSLSLFCGDSGVAQELAQEALMRACRDWSKVRQMNSPAGWVHTVGMNLARSYYRRKRAERRALARLGGSASNVQPSAEQAIAMRGAVARLPRRQRQALVLRYYVDLGIDEVAAAMECSATTVKNLIRKALGTLRDVEGMDDLKETDDVG